jgi:hypothetical protein
LSGTPKWDVAEAFVVRAGSEDEARRFASQGKGDEGAECWLDPKSSRCSVLTTEGTPGVVIRDFCNG